MSNNISLKGEINLDNKGNLEGTLSKNSQVFGAPMTTAGLSGALTVGKVGSKEAVLYVEQELTEEEQNQARKNSLTL